MQSDQNIFNMQISRTMGDSRKNLQSIEEKPESPSFGVRARPGRAGRGRPFALESPLAVH